MNELIYFGVAIFSFAGGCAVGYLWREAKYWEEVATEWKQKRIDIQSRGIS